MQTRMKSAIVIKVHVVNHGLIRLYIGWAAAGFLEAESKFRTVKGYRQIPMLMKALHQCAHPEQYQGESSITA
jgi:hypothetical protein